MSAVSSRSSHGEPSTEDGRENTYAGGKNQLCLVKEAEESQHIFRVQNDNQRMNAKIHDLELRSREGQYITSDVAG